MRTLSILPWLLITVPILAQSKANERFAFGFFAGLETQSLGVQALDSREPEKAAVQPGRLGNGPSLGVMARKRIWKGLFFQPELSVSYLNNQVLFKTEGKQQYRFIDAELPIHFVATNWRRSDFPLHGCILFGGRMAWNLSENHTNLLKIAQERFALDLGLGAEIKIRHWRLQPAFVYSHGLNNLHLTADGKYDGVVGRMVRDKLTFRVSFWPSKK